jgi:tetratricopeptide (TPR) repeat protein
MRSRDPGLLRDQLGRGAPDLAQLLPELSDVYGEFHVPPSSDPEGARFRLFEATASFLRSASMTQPLVLVLDDLHAADAPSLLLLRFLAGELEEARLLVLAVYRDVDPSVREPLADALADLRRQPVTRSLPLIGLPEPDVASFVSLTVGLEPSAPLVKALHQTTDGNPLFVGEAVRLLTSEEALESITDAETWRRMLPEGVRAVIRRRLRRLSDNCGLVLVLASMLGREFDLAALERVSEVESQQLLEVLDEAAEEHVVTDLPGQPGRMRFAHVLIRDTIYDDLTAGRRVQLHRRVGDALEELYADNLEPHLAELAYHFYESARPAVAEKALTYAHRAAERSLRLLAYEEAARLFAVALRVLDSMEAPNDSIRCELLLALGDAHARAGNTPRSKEAYTAAARLAETLHLPAQLSRAALGYGGRFVWDASRDDESFLPLLERAIAALGDEDSSARVKLLARLAGGPLRDAPADAERRRSLGAQALQMARRLGEPSTLVYALQGYISSHLSPEFTPQQLELAREVVVTAQEAGDVERVIEGHQLHIEASIELGDISSAHADLEEMMRLAEDLRQPAQRWLVAVWRTLLALLEGRFEEAEQLLTEHSPHADRPTSWNARVTYRLQLFLLRREQGRLEEVENLVALSARECPTYPIWRCALATTLCDLGSTTQARAELEALATNRFGRLPFDEEWTVSLCFLAETALRLLDKDRAATLYELLLPYAERVAVSYPEISLGPVSRFLGLLASATGRLDDAERHFRQAMQLSARISARPSLAHAQEDYARMLLARGERGDVTKASELADEAVSAYRELGMDPWAAAVSSLRETGSLRG